MHKFDVNLDQLIFEIRYAFGHLYFDRRGQCLNDIESKLNGWITAGENAKRGSTVLERADRNFRVGFSDSSFDFTAQSVARSGLDLESIVEEILNVWSIVKANLGISEYVRYGCRFWFLLPALSIEEAERKILKSEFNVAIPNYIGDAGLITRSISAMASLKYKEQESDEYRVQLGSVVRGETIEVPEVLSVEPRYLHAKQREYRLEKLKRVAEYSASPKYAILLDVDCLRLEPDKSGIAEFIYEKAKVVEKSFLPILRNL